MNKAEALEYLVKNNVYCDEWSGAGMYEALSKIIESEEKIFTQEYLDDLLEIASKF
jgi:hypothetical protein